MDELIVDSFAGGGGASTGIELATGREYPKFKQTARCGNAVPPPLCLRPSCAQTCLSGAGVNNEVMEEFE